MKDRIFEQLRQHVDNSSLKDFALNKDGEIPRNLQAMVGASVYLLRSFPKSGEQGSAPYEFANLIWKFRKASTFKGNPFDPKEVHSAIETLVSTVAEGRVLPNFDPQTSQGKPINLSETFSIQFDVRYDGTDKYNYATVIMGEDFADALESPLKRGEALARLYASGNLIQQIENELASPALEGEAEEMIVPVMKQALLGMGQMLVHHQGFREFYSIMQKQEANPY